MSRLPSRHRLLVLSSEIQQSGVRARAMGPRFEQYHGHLMGVNRNGAGVGAFVASGVTNMAHFTLCYVDDGGVDCQL